MIADASSTSPISRLTCSQSLIPTPPGLSTKRRRTPRGRSGRHSTSTSSSPWSRRTGITTSSIWSVRTASSIGTVPLALWAKLKKAGNAHFFRNLARIEGGGKAPPPRGGRLVPRFGGPDRVDSVDDLVLRDAALLARLAGADLDDALLHQGVADGDADGNAEEVGVLELRSEEHTSELQSLAYLVC